MKTETKQNERYRFPPFPFDIKLLAKYKWAEIKQNSIQHCRTTTSALQRALNQISKVTSSLF